MEFLNLSNQEIKTTSETNLDDMTKPEDGDKPADDYLVFRSYQKGFEDMKALMGLPEPNPLQKKRPPPRGKIKTLYSYIRELKQKFKGREMVNKTFLEDISASQKNLPNGRGRDYLAERRNNREAREAREAKEQAEPDENRILDKLVNYFKDEEKIVYKRSNKLANIEDFNSSKYNLRKYMAELQLKQKDENETTEKTEMDSDSFQEEFKDSFYKPASNQDTTLVFESRFESGNLSIVSKVNDNEYNMIMQNDINTLGYCQWFFFECKNTRKGHKVKFNLMNFRKTDSLFNHGMKVLVYSIKNHERNAVGWVRGGKNLTYQINGIPRDNMPDKIFRTFSFEYEFEHDYDKVFFAYSHPYTYSDLCDYLDKIEMDEQKSKMMCKTTLCNTIAGNKCELLTITNNNVPGECNHKKCIFLTARVHPGETNSSFMMQGTIDFLLSDHPDAERLRNKYIFKIIPMLNPDGVIHGCSRCELSGVDLNRKWRNPSEVLHPTIYHAKKLIQELHTRYKVVFFCDFHGHSKKRNIFIYGCQNDNKPFQCREFPWILAKLSPDCFNFLNCSYTMSKFKAGAARITLNEVLNIPLSYTLEASFYGSDKLQRHFTVDDLVNFGKTFCKALAVMFCDRSPIKNRSHNTPNPTKKTIGLTSSTILKTEENKDEFNKDDLLKDLYDIKNMVEDNSDSGSESNVSEDELGEEVMNRLVPKNERKFVKKSVEKTVVKRTNSIPITPNHRPAKPLPLNINTSVLKPKENNEISSKTSNITTNFTSSLAQSENIMVPQTSQEQRMASPSDEPDHPRSRRIEKKPKSMKPFERDRYSQPRILASQLILKNYEKAEIRINHLNFPSKAQQRGLTKVVLEKLRDKVKDDEEKTRKTGEFFPKIHTRDIHENNLVKAKLQLEESPDKLSNFTASLRAARSEAKALNDRKRKFVTYQPTVITIIDQNKTNDTGVKGTWGDPDPKIIELLEKIISAKVVSRGELEHNFVSNQPVDPREFKYNSASQDNRTGPTNYMNSMKKDPINHFFSDPHMKQMKKEEEASLSNSSILKRIQEQDMINSARNANQLTDPTPKDTYNKISSALPSSISKRVRGQS